MPSTEAASATESISGSSSYDYDKDYPFAAFITNLGKYNEGALVGEWVKFPTTAEELKKVFERIGIGAKDDFGQTYEEWFITDYDCYVDGLYDLLGEYANLDELNYLASKLDDMSQDEYERFQAANSLSPCGERIPLSTLPVMGCLSFRKSISETVCFYRLTKPYCSLTKKAFGQNKADGYNLSVWSRSAGAP